MQSRLPLSSLVQVYGTPSVSKGILNFGISFKILEAVLKSWKWFYNFGIGFKILELVLEFWKWF